MRILGVLHVESDELLPGVMPEVGGWLTAPAEGQDVRVFHHLLSLTDCLVMAHWLYEVIMFGQNRSLYVQILFGRNFVDIFVERFLLIFCTILLALNILDL